MKLLLVEDDDLVYDSLKLALSSAGYAVERAKSGIGVDNLSVNGSFDLIILDLGLPGMDGMECLRLIRKQNTKIPVLILTARDSPEHRIAGLDSGANDCVIKPFHLGELQARIRALLRTPADNAQVVTVGDLEWNPQSRSLRRGAELIELSPKENAVLEALLENMGALVTKHRLALILGEDGSPATWNAIDLNVHRLRKRLEPFGLKLKTIRGLGFLAES